MEPRWPSLDGVNQKSATSWLGTRGVALGADATMEDQVRDLFRNVVETFGRLDGLYHVAGGSGRRWGDGPLHKSPMRDGKRRFDGIWIRSSYPTVPLFINSWNKRPEGRS